MEGKMRYCLYAGPEWVAGSYPLSAGVDMTRPIPASALPDVMHSGLTNWSKVFEGHLGIPATKEELEAFDVIHVNLSGGNVGYIRRLHRQMEMLDVSRRPMIVANPDYAIDMWNSYARLDLFLQDIDLADRIFCVHNTMADTLITWLDRKVYTLPHPTDVKRLQKVYLPQKESKFPYPTIMVLAHSYDQNTLIVTETVDRYRRRVNPNIRLLLVGPVEHDKVWNKSVYDEVHDQIPFEALAGIIARVDVVIDTAVTHSYGRIGVECAALQTPVIGHDKVESIAFQGCIDIYNAKQLTTALDDAFAGNWKHADVTKYSYDNSRMAFMRMVDGNV